MNADKRWYARERAFFRVRIGRDNDRCFDFAKDTVSGVISVHLR